MNAPAKKPEQKKDVQALMLASKKQIDMALPKHLTADRFARIALTELRKNPKLNLCDPMSFLGSVMQAAQLGLEPGSALGHAYLIPRKINGVLECTFMPGYRGYIDLARRSGQVKSIRARIVREKDHFVYRLGDEERIDHVPYEVKGDPEDEDYNDDAGRITHVYAIAVMSDGELVREVMTRGQIDRIMERNGNNNDVWKTDFDEMARKTVVRRIAKYLPMSPEFANATEADDKASRGESQENWRVIDVDYQPTPERHDPDKINREREEAGKTPPPPTEPEKAKAAATATADKSVAFRDLSAAVKRVMDLGASANEILKTRIDVAHICQGKTNHTVAELSAMADKLNAWTPAAPTAG